MESKKALKTVDALKDLSLALEEYEETESEETKRMRFLAVTKAFEVSLEYLWKYFKSEVEDRGLEAPSPKDAVRAAAEIHLTDTPELYIQAINARNQSVHDYFSMSEEDFVKLIRNFLKLANTDVSDE